MPDMEKVIKGLEQCGQPTYCDACPYYSEMGGCFRNLKADALNLLKEQEPIRMKVLEDYGSIKFGYCPKCKSLINNRSYPKSCGCGQKVKWE